MLPPENISNFNSPEPDRFALESLQWIKAAKQGEIKAFEQLYRYYYPRVYRYLFFALRLPGETEQVTNQVFSLAWQRLSADSSSCQLEAFSLWLYQLAYQLLVSGNLDPKSIPLSKSLDLPSEEADATQQASLAGNQNSISSTPNQSSSTPNSTPNLRQSLLGLKFEAQLILYLHYLEQRSYSEIAQILDLSQELVQAKHVQALQDLRLLMHYEPDQQNN